MSLRKSSAVISAGLLLILCLAASTINAQDTQDGMESKTPRAATSTAGPSLMGPVATGGPWIEFGFMGSGIMSTGCSPADPAGPACTPSSGGNSVFGTAPPWTFTSPSGANLTVTDAFLRGGQFEVFDFGVSLGLTSVPATTGSCGSDPDPCLLDPGISKRVYSMAAGPHSITIKATISPVGSGAAYFRIDAAPSSLDHYVCYEIKKTQQFRRRRVAIRNQFEGVEYWVVGPKLLCVPSSKKLLE